MKPDRSQVILLNKVAEGKWTQNPDTGLIDVEGSVSFTDYASGKKHSKLPISFGNVTGNFICKSLNLETLEGSPHTVGRNFDCSHNKLINLSGSPREVGGSFSCNDNCTLKRLFGAPVKIGGVFDCSGCNLDSLEYLPEGLEHDLFLSSNAISNLGKLPKVIKGSLYIAHNPIINFNHAPSEIGGILNIIGCNLATLKGMPKTSLLAINLSLINEEYRYDIMNEIMALESEGVEIQSDFEDYREEWLNREMLKVLND